MMPAKFAEMDADGNGEMDYGEFCTGFGFTKSPLTKKLFDAFDQDQSGEISVVEASISLCSSCVFSSSSLTVNQRFTAAPSHCSY